MTCPNCGGPMDYRTGCFVHVHGSQYIACDMAVCGECGCRRLCNFAGKTHEIPGLVEADPHGLVVGKVVVT